MKTGIIILVASLAALAQAQDEVNIDCTFRDVGHPLISTQSTCVVKSTDPISIKGTKVTTINASANIRRTIKVFSAAHIVIKYIPVGLIDRFPDLIGLSFTSTKLAYVSQDDLKPFGDKLQSLTITSNDIQVLEKDLFASTPNIKYLNLRSNKISYMDPNVFVVIRSSLQQFFIVGQAIICNIGEGSTPVTVAKALDSVVSSKCVESTNAPAVYAMYVEKCKSEKLPDPAEIEAMRVA